MRKKFPLTKEDIRVGKSYAGLGLFAKRDIPVGSFIEYVGPLLNPEEVAKLSNPRYLFEINTRWTINGALRENVARYINHSCKPNSESSTKGKQVFITTILPLKKGEEFTYDYGEEYVEEFIKPHGCKCGKCAKRSENAQ